MKELVNKLSVIQSTLKAPKNQRNNFGNYSYRSCEDILEAVKPLLAEHFLVLTVNDDIVEIGGRVYVKATATITDGTSKITNSSFARESETKKGMDDSQITGSTSSYARKYCLNGLFLIDDTKDSDATNTHGKEEQKQMNGFNKTASYTKPSTEVKATPVVTQGSEAPKKGGFGAKRTEVKVEESSDGWS